MDQHAPVEPPVPAHVAELIRTIRREKRSLVDEHRLENLARLVIERHALGGALVECGVARGGALALMRAVAGPDQVVWGFDSFEGMPPLTAEDGNDGRPWVGIRCGEGRRAVDATFALLDLPTHEVHVVEGWFEETLPARVVDVGPIAVLRLDSDWYRATRFCLDMLYDSVVAGGVVVVDDYSCFAGCRRAVDEFREERAITATLHRTDAHNEAYWVVDR